MSRDHDGLDEYEDSALVRALRAPGTPEELAGEDQFVAAYRHSFHPHDRGRVIGRIGRIGAGGVALLATVTLTGGVAAAAYTQRLPHSVQAVAHDAFGGIGVPPARPATSPPPEPRATPAPHASPSATEGADEPRFPEATRSTAREDRDSPSDESSAGVPSDPVTSTAPAGTATGSATATPGSPTGTTSPTAPAPGTPTGGAGLPAASPTTVSTTASARRVVTGGRASVTGVVLDDGEPVVGEQVWLLQRHRGERWTRLASAVTGSDGSATFATGPLSQNTFFRIRVEVDTDGDDEADRTISSHRRRIGVQPVLTLSATGPALAVHTVGADPGDAIVVSRRAADGRLVRLGIRRLDQQGEASYDLSSYSGRLRVQVRVLRTATHTAVKRWITVRVPREPKPPAAPPTPSASPTEEPAGSAGSSTTSGS